MVNPLGSYISSSSFFRRAETAKKRISSANFYLSKPFAGVFVKSDSKESRSIPRARTTLVLTIKRLRQNAKINKSVVVTYAVDMVNVSIRPSAIGVIPGKPMGKKNFPVNAKLSMPMSINRARTAIPAANAITRNAPLEKPCFWCVLKNFLEVQMSKLGPVFHQYIIA